MRLEPKKSKIEHFLAKLGVIEVPVYFGTIVAPFEAEAARAAFSRENPAATKIGLSTCVWVLAQFLTCCSLTENLKFGNFDRRELKLGM